MSIEKTEKKNENKFSINREKIEAGLTEFPICEYAFIDPANLSFSDRVRWVCEHECERYNTSWACPPAVGSVEECRARCARFTGGFIFTTVSEVADIENLEETLATRMEHEEITRQVRDLFQRENPQELLVLSTESCAICRKCAWPDAACRHPERMFPCVESYGIIVSDIAEKYGISFLNGQNVATWFSLILYC
ncbi:MAG: DUF2284 domain-containing protein [Lachnospiraceae bacterium]|nr:DUF2284 domain-containing protein [Lachnospiraceae bacterium]